MSDWIEWSGASGKTYSHLVISRDIAFQWTLPANYVLVRNDGRRWNALYFGKTQRPLKERMEEHRDDGLLEKALRLGMNEVHVHLAVSESARMAAETDLRNWGLTPLNKQGLGLSDDTPRPRNRLLGDILAGLSVPRAEPKGLLSLGDYAPDPFLGTAPPVNRGLGLAAYAPATTNYENLGTLARLYADNKLLGR